MDNKTNLNSRTHMGHCLWRGSQCQLQHLGESRSLRIYLRLNDKEVDLQNDQLSNNLVTYLTSSAGVGLLLVSTTSIFVLTLK